MSIALIAVAVAFAALVAVALGAWLTGRLTVDLGWGRIVQPLGPITIDVSAPRSLVYEVASSPYLRPLPRALRGEIEIVERGRDMVIAAHHTKLRRVTSTTVESVRFEEPERITFRLLRGIAPSVTEEFAFRETAAGTRVTYTGELGMDLWAVGRLAGALLVKPTWERVVRAHMERIKDAGQSRARSPKHRAG